MNRKNILTYSGIGAVSFAATLGLMNLSSQPKKEKNAIGIYYTNVDDRAPQNNPYDDAVVGYKDKSIDIWVNTTPNNFKNLDEIRTKEVSTITSERDKELQKEQEWYNAQLTEIENNFRGLEQRLLEKK